MVSIVAQRGSGPDHRAEVLADSAASRRTGGTSVRSHPLATSIPAVGLLAALFLSGCASSNDGDVSTLPEASGSASGADSQAKALVPAEIRTSGVIRAATDATYPPNEFTGPDGKTLMGFDIDLGNAVAQRLGLKIEFANAKFDTILTGIQGNRYDVAFSSFTDNKERQAKVDFVDYFTAGTSILVKKGNPERISKLEDLCGKKVALESGTVQVDIAKNAKCPPGKPIQVTQLPDDAAARLQVKTGRVVADMNDFPVAAYTAKTSGGGNDFEVVGTQYETAPYGIAVSKQLPGLRDAIQAVLKAMVGDGSYQAILKKWDIEQGAVTDITINAGS
jgi:polar amino acid transport system substrate-binding protein